MFGQDTKWGDSGPMDCNNVYEPESTYFEVKYDPSDYYYMDNNNDINNKFNKNFDIEEKFRLLMVFWQINIDLVHKTYIFIKKLIQHFLYLNLKKTDS